MTPSPRANPSGPAGGLYPLAVMALRRGRNRLRRLLQRPIWLLVWSLLGVAVLLPILRAPLDPGPLAAPAARASGLAAVWILVSVASRLWEATARPPFTLAQADASLLLPSPISSRQILLFQLIRSALGRLAVQIPFLALWALLLHRIGYPLSRSGLAGFYLLTVIVSLWGDGVHTFGWLALERVPPGRSLLARRLVRLLLVAGTLLGLGWLAGPILRALAAGRLALASSLAGSLLERAHLLASAAPLSWAVALLEAAFGQAPWNTAAVAGCFAGVAFLWMAALGLGEDYYESLVLQGEEDARLRQVTASWNVDVQGAAVERLGVLRRLRRVPRLPWRGGGAWALFWEQANRWLRLELGSWWLSLLGLGFLGGIVGLARRAGAAPFWLWLVPAALALLSAPWGYLAEELRRPYIYLIPDRPWRRLIAASLVSAVDVFVSYGWMLVVAAGVATEGLEAVAVGLVLLLAIAWVTQAAMALTAVVVPPWLGRTTRVVIQSILSMAALGPGVLAAVAAHASGGGQLLGAVLGLVVTLLMGAGLFRVAAALFHRAEMAD